MYGEHSHLKGLPSVVCEAWRLRLGHSKMEAVARVRAATSRQHKLCAKTKRKWRERICDEGILYYPGAGFDLVRPFILCPSLTTMVCVSYVDPGFEGRDGKTWSDTTPVTGPPWTTRGFAERLESILRLDSFVLPGSVRVKEQLHARPSWPHPGLSQSCEGQMIHNRIEFSFEDATNTHRTIVYYLNEDFEMFQAPELFSSVRPHGC